MNLMPYIIKSLGLEIDEEFTLKGENGLYWYKLGVDGLLFRTWNTKFSPCKSSVLEKILTGKDEIIKLPFQPKLGEKYYTIIFGEGKQDTLEVDWSVWKGSSIDYMRKHFKITYRSRIEAEEDKFNGFKRIMGTI